jgi:hypothetical protein
MAAGVTVCFHRGSPMAAIRDLPFDAWVRHVFDHDPSGRQWWFEADAPRWAGPPDVTVAYVTRLFEDPLPPLAPYDDVQLDEGFWYLVANGASDCMMALLDTSVPVERRARCLRAAATVFREVYAPRCTPHLGHCDEPGAGPLNLSCYMWWDLLPVAPAPDDPGRRLLDRAALDAMEEILSLDAIACQESALHGLGHWQPAHPDAVAAIVDAFLAAAPDRRPELVRYAESARVGCVQ